MHARTHTHTQWKNDYTVLQYDKHVKLQWVDVIKWWLKNMNKCLWKGSRNESESWPYCRGCTWPKKKFWERSQNCKLPDARGMISHVRASFSKDWMGNAAKSVTLWASRQNGLLMPRLIVAYASWPSRHSVNSTNYASLPQVWSQGQGRGSVANGLLAKLLASGI